MIIRGFGNDCNNHLTFLNMNNYDYKCYDYKYSGE